MPRIVKTPLERRVLRQILKGRTNPKTVARSLRISLDDLGACIQRPRMVRIIRGLSGLGDAYAALRLSQERSEAVTALVRMAKSDAGNETQRRACADMIKNSAGFEPAPQAGGSGGEGGEGSAAERLDDHGRQLLQRALSVIGSGQLRGERQESPKFKVQISKVDGPPMLNIEP